MRKSAIGLKSGLSHTHGGISKTVSVNVVNSHSGELHRSESEERIHVPGMPKAFDGDRWSAAAMPREGLQVGDGSLVSKKSAGSVTTASIESLERRP
jgi:hypothetical protein